MPLWSLDSVRVFCRDFSAAETFYRTALALTVVVAAPRVAIFSTGGMKLILEAQPPDDPETGILVGRFTGISFSVPHLDAATGDLASKGVVFYRAAELQGWGGRLVHFFDPDENILTLVEYPSD
ncbi:MAG: VOC family protein [Kiloniellaceae bacterium]